MRIKKIIGGFLMITLLVQGCQNDIDLFNPDQQRTYVVFGLLNSTDPLQQVKIRMTSVTDAPISELMADTAEFSAPPGLDVSIQEWQNDYYAVFPLQKVTYPKDPGIFFNARNDVYQAMISPYPDMFYKLMIVNPADGTLITSKIYPVQAPKLGAPTWPWIRYNFSNEGDPFRIRFNEVPRANVYLIQFAIRYIEVNLAGDTVQLVKTYVHKPRFVDDPPEYSPKHLNLGNEHTQPMTMKGTYNIFNQIIPDNPEVVWRQLICFEIAVWAGDQNLRNYTELELKFTDNRKQGFTNIINGIGFFGACSHSDCTGILPDKEFMDSLPLYSRTSHLKFRTDLYKQGTQPAPANKNDFFSLIPHVSDAGQ